MKINRKFETRNKKYGKKTIPYEKPIMPRPTKPKYKQMSELDKITAFLAFTFIK